MQAFGAERRSFVRAGAWIVAGLAAARAGAQGKPEKSRVVIAVEGRATFAFLPLTIAERLGYFAAEGLEVEMVDVGGPLRASHGGPDGLGDVVGGSFGHTIDWQSRGMFFRGFVLLGRAPQIALGVSTRTMTRFKSVVDLKGRKIGLPASAPMAAMVAGLVLARFGLSPKEVHFQEFPNSAATVAAMRAGQIDAISATEPVLSMLESRNELRVIADTRTLKGTQEVFGGAMPGASLFAAQEFLQRNPNTVQALVNGTVHALKWLQTAGPSDIIKVVPDPYLLGDRGLYLASFNKVREAFAVDGLISDDGVRTAVRAVGRNDELIKTERIDPLRTYTNEFARRAKDKYRA
ncbi:MAG: ABC transporter substrate-binding protein [Burkholderiaceae bacterium]